MSDTIEEGEITEIMDLAPLPVPLHPPLPPGPPPVRPPPPQAIVPPVTTAQAIVPPVTTAQAIVPSVTTAQAILPPVTTAQAIAPSVTTAQAIVPSVTTAQAIVPPVTTAQAIVPPASVPPSIVSAVERAETLKPTDAFLNHAPLIRVVSSGTIPPPPPLGDSPPPLPLGPNAAMEKSESPFASFFSVTTGVDATFLVKATAPIAIPKATARGSGAVEDVLTIRDVMRSSSQDSTLEDPLCGSATPSALDPSSKRKMPRMAWGQGLKRQVSVGGTVSNPPVTPSATAAEVDTPDMLPVVRQGDEETYIPPVNERLADSMPVDSTYSVDMPKESKPAYKHEEANPAYISPPLVSASVPAAETDCIKERPKVSKPANVEPADDTSSLGKPTESKPKETTHFISNRCEDDKSAEISPPATLPPTAELGLVKDSVKHSSEEETRRLDIVTNTNAPNEKTKYPVASPHALTPDSCGVSKKEVSHKKEKNIKGELTPKPVVAAEATATAMSSGDTPNTGISLKLSASTGAFRLKDTPPSSALPPSGIDSHKKRAMRGVSDNNLQFSSENSGQSGALLKRRISSNDDLSGMNVQPVANRSSSGDSQLGLCIDGDGAAEGMKRPRAEGDTNGNENGSNGEAKREPKKHKKHGDDTNDDDDGVVKRKRGRPSIATPLAGGPVGAATTGRGAGAGGGNKSRGGGRQGRGANRRRADGEEGGVEVGHRRDAVSTEQQGPYIASQVCATTALESQGDRSAGLGGIGDIGSGGDTPAAPASRILLLGSNSVKLCKTHRQRLKNKQQRDAMMTILCGKQDNINVFVAIHEIVRLELDTQGIDLMRLDPSQVIDPRIIQLLRNISHPSSIINLSILNSSDVAASLNLLETKGHKLFAELNLILQEMHRLQRERSRLYDLHLRNLEQRQRAQVQHEEEAQRRATEGNTSHVLKSTVSVAIRVNDGADNLPNVADTFIESSSGGAYGCCHNPPKSSMGSHCIVTPADHPLFLSLCKGVREDNRLTIDEATFSTSARSMHVTQNAVVPPDFVGLHTNLAINDVHSNVVTTERNNLHSAKLLESLEFANAKKKMEANRISIMKEVRKRKLAMQGAWEYLTDQFEETQHKWDHHVGIQRAEIAEKQAALDSMTRSQAAAALASENADKVGNTPMAGLGSAGGLGDYALPTAPRFGGSSTRGRGGTAESVSDTPTTDATPSGGSRLYGMRSTANSSSAGNLFGLGGETGLYDHDAVMQQILQAELMQKRIATGWAPVPDLLSPWVGPKRTEVPPPNVWPQSIAKLYVPEKKSEFDTVPAFKVEPHAVMATESSLVTLSDTEVVATMKENADPKAEVLGAVRDMVNQVVSRVADSASDVDVADAVLTELIDRVIKDEIKEVAVKAETDISAMPAVAEEDQTVSREIQEHSGDKVIAEDDIKTEANLPNLEFPAPFPSPPAHIDLYCNRLTTNGMRQTCGYWPTHQPCPLHCNCALKVDIEERRCRVWTDMEKCIFADKFIQYPKNFGKIASFLVNRSVRDCVKFYYDSKHSFGFKALLRECQARRRAVKCTWRHGIIAGASAGGAVFAPDDNDNKRPVFELPVDDMTYLTRTAHPPNTDSLLNLPTPLLVCRDRDANEVVTAHHQMQQQFSSGSLDSQMGVTPVPGSSVFSGTRLPTGIEVSKTAAALASCLDGRYMRPKTASGYLRRLVDTGDSDSDVEEEPIQQIRNNGYLASVMKKRKFEISNTMTGGLSNAARIVADVEKAVNNSDASIVPVSLAETRMLGDSITCNVIHRPWRISMCCGVEASAAPPPPSAKDEVASLSISGAAALSGLGMASPGNALPTKGGGGKGGKGGGKDNRDTSIMSPSSAIDTDGRGRGDTDGRGRGRGRGRGSRGGRGGRGKPTGSDRSDGDGLGDGAASVPSSTVTPTDIISSADLPVSEESDPIKSEATFEVEAGGVATKDVSASAPTPHLDQIPTDCAAAHEKECEVVDESTQNKEIIIPPAAVSEGKPLSVPKSSDTDKKSANQIISKVVDDLVASVIENVGGLDVENTTTGSIQSAEELDAEAAIKEGLPQSEACCDVTSIPSAPVEVEDNSSSPDLLVARKRSREGSDLSIIAEFFCVEQSDEAAVNIEPPSPKRAKLSYSPQVTTSVHIEHTADRNIGYVLRNEEETNLTENDDMEVFHSISEPRSVFEAGVSPTISIATSSSNNTTSNNDKGSSGSSALNVLPTN